MANELSFRPIDPGVRIGHVHLKVADLERSLAFYRDVLGFELTQRFGSQAAFLSAAHSDDDIDRTVAAINNFFMQ